MKINEIETFVGDVLMHYGPSAQIEKAIEELSELSAALHRWSLSMDDAELEAAVVDEIADVGIMSMSMRAMFGEDAVDQRIEFKMNRQRERMECGE